MNTNAFIFTPITEEAFKYTDNNLLQFAKVQVPIELIVPLKETVCKLIHPLKA